MYRIVGLWNYPQATGTRPGAAHVKHFSRYYTFRSSWIPGSYASLVSKNRNVSLSPLKSKGFKEEIVTKIGLYDLLKPTTLESNKSLVRDARMKDLPGVRCQKRTEGRYLGTLACTGCRCFRCIFCVCHSPGWCSSVLGWTIRASILSNTQAESAYHRRSNLSEGVEASHPLSRLSTASKRKIYQSEKTKSYGTNNRESLSVNFSRYRTQGATDSPPNGCTKPRLTCLATRRCHGLCSCPRSCLSRNCNRTFVSCCSLHDTAYLYDALGRRLSLTSGERDTFLTTALRQDRPALLPLRASGKGPSLKLFLNAAPG